MVDCRGQRVAAVEARVVAEAESVKEHFAELQSFITFNLTRQSAELKAEFTRDSAELRTELKRDLSRVERRLESLERKVDTHHEATKLVLAEILDRLPAR
jgi:hypothetical protein